MTNTLSTEAPTDFGGNFAFTGCALWKTSQSKRQQGLQSAFIPANDQLIIFYTKAYKPRFIWAARGHEQLVHREANRDCGQLLPGRENSELFIHKKKSGKTAT
ncbi:hypothetical protein [Pseudomonas cichorii]|uniref:hypothetical protein n=1 Tax=Pseudomonas cichorii TaxID=36746 RepID=UPI0011C44718|nr:hypothetical protein [Pseudomonas cichorii]